MPAFRRRSLRMRHWAARSSTVYDGVRNCVLPVATLTSLALLAAAWVMSSRAIQPPVS